MLVVLIRRGNLLSVDGLLPPFLIAAGLFSDGDDEFAFGEDFGVDVVIPGVHGLQRVTTFEKY